MRSKKPLSFKIFLIIISIVGSVLITSTLFFYYQIDRKYSMILAFFMFIALAFAPVGAYSGFKYKSEEKNLKLLNSIGKIGNTLIFLFIITLMAIAVFLKANQ